ncbi:MAG TPA: hypothetical protein VGZ00_04275 [Candidatus Baltobacteraceae bacterium]|nr:hypothetical protein [Candidatus Baltobacteraceae bacterium]
MSRVRARGRARREGARGERNVVIAPVPHRSAEVVPDEAVVRRWMFTIRLLVIGSVTYIVGVLIAAFAFNALVGAAFLIIGLLALLAAMIVSMKRYDGLPTTGPSLARLRIVMWALLGVSLALLAADYSVRDQAPVQLARVLHLAWLPPFAWFSVLSARFIQRSTPPKGSNASSPERGK